MRFDRQLREARDRVGNDLLDRLLVVPDSVDERGIGAVLEQPAHEIREQVLMAADRRIDPAWPAEMLRSGDLLVERLAHTVEPLKLVLPAVTSHFENGGGGMRIVGRKLWIEGCSVIQQPSRAGEIGDVSGDLAGVDGIAVEPPLLGALDPALPIRALD